LKKTAIVILALALLITFAAVPVMAKPTKGQKVPVKEYITSPPFDEIAPVRYWITKGGIAQMRAMQEAYNVTFVIGDPPYAQYDFTHHLVGYGSANTKTTVFVGHFDAVWTLVDDDSSGFSGNMEMTAYGFDLAADTWSSWSVHEVAQGFGAFAGQTLKLSLEGPLDITAPFTGYLLKG
jgi:hypothetical protein